MASELATETVSNDNSDIENGSTSDSAEHKNESAMDLVIVRPQTYIIPTNPEIEPINNQLQQFEESDEDNQQFEEIINNLRDNNITDADDTANNIKIINANDNDSVMDIEISEQEESQQYEQYEHEEKHETEEENKTDDVDIDIDIIINKNEQYDKEEDVSNDSNTVHTPLQEINNSSKIYNEYMRRLSISTSDIPHSLQVLTPQRHDRPKDDVLGQIYDMGFDRDLAEKAYNKLLRQNNGDHGAFTTEHVLEIMLSQDLHINEEEEELEIVDLNVTNDDNVGVHVREDNNRESIQLIECPICRTDKVSSKIYNTSCGHNYCALCLTKHYQTSIENGVVSFVCMDQECERHIDEEELFLFIHDQVYKNKYYKFLRNVKLAKDPTIRWCVKAGCDTPIKRKSRKQIKLECTKCKTIVCYHCAGLYYNKKNKKAHDCNKELDDKLVNWAKTKCYDVQFCPKCFARIEKLSGCNHMKCSYCKYEFCWLCRKEFKKGHYDPNNILFGCPGGENASKKPNKCSACCILMRSCALMCCLPLRICWWRMTDQGFPWCFCWCCCQD